MVLKFSVGVLDVCSFSIMLVSVDVGFRFNEYSIVFP